MSAFNELNARTERLLPMLRRMVRRGNVTGLQKLLKRERAEDIAASMHHLTWSEQRALYRAVEDRDSAADLLAFLPESSVREVAREITEEVMVDILDRMEPDDATDIVGVLPDELRARVLAGLDDEEDDVRGLLAWPPDSAGGIMSTAFFALPDTATAGVAVQQLQRDGESVENVNYVYVVDARGVLIGVVSLRNLVVRPPHTPIVRFMTRDPITVGPMVDQEEVARYVARYDLLAIPVIDDQGCILGIVTVDDVVDVIREEANEDMMRMAGVSDDAGDAGAVSVGTHVRRRFGWLLATVLGGIFAREIISGYEDSLEARATIAGFIPVIMGMGGNVGIQSATVAVRGLAMGHVQLGGAFSFVAREAQVGVLLGIAYGAVLGLYGVLRPGGDPSEAMLLGVSVGLSVLAATSGASLLGGGIPVLLSRFKVDPAVATGPLVTTLIDVIAVIMYFNIVQYMLGI